MAIGRFAAFFLVSAFPDESKEKLVASCELVGRELAQLEAHQIDPAIGEGAGAPFRLGDGE